MSLSDDQLKLICEYLLTHSPKATIQEGVVVPASTLVKVEAKPIEPQKPVTPVI